jgi:hypothetical protein
MTCLNTILYKDLDFINLNKIMFTSRFPLSKISNYKINFNSKIKILIENSYK